jgi:Zn finger protein HypA/HybF involved in hydrogenase expression
MSKIISRSDSGKGKMLKIEDKENKKGYIWYFMTEPVIAFVDKVGITDNDEIEFVAEELKGEETITHITKFPQKQEESQFKCEKCNAPLKDNKYKTCYTCNMKAKEEEANSPEGKAKQESIERQAIMKCSSITVATAMAGQIADVNVLGDNIIILYKKLLAEILK